MKSIIRWFRIGIILPAALLASLLSGCDGASEGASGKPFDSFGSFDDNKPYEGRVQVSEEEKNSNEAFISRITYGEGIGEFGLTPLKFGKEPWDFFLIVENRNPFPAGAYITFAMKDEAGEVISAGEKSSRVLKEGARDIIKADLGDGASFDFAALEITAYIRENDGNGEAVYENVDPEGIKEVGNVATGRGRRIDLEYEEPHGAYTSDYGIFYDSDDNVYRVEDFITSGGDGAYACLYTEFDYARYEILAFKQAGEAGGLPAEAYSAYKEAGLVSETGNEYETLEGNVSYAFEEASDGEVLIRCRNNTSELLAMSMDSFILPGGERRAYDWDKDLILRPAEELCWNTGISSSASFYMLPVSSNRTEPEEPVPELEVSEADGRLHYEVTWDTCPHENELKARLLILYRGGDETVFTETIDIENDYDHIVEGDASYEGSFDEYEVYMQYRYEIVPVEGV